LRRGLPEGKHRVVRPRGFLVSCLFAAACSASPTVGELAEEVKVCPAGAVTEGIDVSVYQGNIDWAKVKADGVEFAWIRVSDGLPPIDTKFHQNWTGARAAGVLRGAYQFFRENEDPIAQADLLLDTMGPLEPDDLPPAIDIESVDGSNPTELVSNVGKWLHRVEDATGRKPILYTGRPFWDTNAGGSMAYAAYGLWIPNWGVSCPSISNAWSSWVVWQYSATGSVSGISGNVDRDRFNGDRAALLDWIGTSPPPTPDAGVGPAAPDARPVPVDPPDAGGGGPAFVGGSDLVGGCGLVPGDGGGLLVVLGALGYAHARRRRARGG
jgi:lysozyme